MINEQLLSYSREIGKDIYQYGSKLTVKEGTPLGVLRSYFDISPDTIKSLETIDEVKSLESLDNNDNEFFKKIIEDISFSFPHNQSGGMALYDQVMDHLSLEISKDLKEHIKFIKTDVIPIIKEIDESFNDEMSIADTGNIYNCDIVLYSLPDILIKEESLFARYADDIGIGTDWLKFPSLPELQEEELEELIKTGNKNFDINLREASLSEGKYLYSDLIYNIYNYIFRHNKETVYTNSYKSFNDDVLTALIAFVLSNNLLNKPLEKAKLRLREYNEFLTFIRGQAGYYLMKAINDYYSAIKNNKLILSCENGKTVVIDELYNNWINEQEGDSDLLLANSLLKTPYQKLDDIINNKEKLLKNWADYTALLDDQNNKRLVIFKKNKLNEIVERKYQQIYFSRGLPNEEIMKNCAIIKNKIFNLAPEDINDNLSKTLVKLTCDSFFPNTDAEISLLNIQATAETNEDMNIEEAALIGILNYVINWVYKQISVNRFKITKFEL